MKRKFISAVLFGALLVAPANVFVSCSDYDDDIANLQGQIDANKAELGALINEKIAALEAEIANLSAADQALSAHIDAVAAQLKSDYEAADRATLAAAQELVRSAQAELQAALDECKATCNQKFEDTNARIDALVAADAALQTAVEAAQAKADAAHALAETAQTKAEAAAELAGTADANATKALEEINKAMAKIDEVNTTLATQISTLSAAVTKAQEDIAANAAAIQAQQTALETYKGEVAGDFTAVETKLGELQSALEAQKTDLEALIAKEVKAVQDQVSGLETTVNQIKAAHDAAIATLQADVKELQDDIKASNARITTLEQDLKKLDDKINLLGMLLNAELRSLVFEPQFYYQGIEAFEAATYHYTALITNKVNADGNFGTDEPIEKTLNNMPVLKTMTPDLTAIYHLNPSNANIDTKDMSKYKFVVLNRDYRASANTISPVIYKADVNSGKVTVKAHFSNAENIQNITDDKAVTVLALQYNKGAGSGADTVITSDYAALMANQYTDFLLNNAYLQGNSQTHVHLFTKATDAINSDENIVEIVWNDADGIDLNTLVNTHYSNSESNDIKWDDNAASGTVEQSGFKYSYDLVGYITGNNKTSATAHFGFKDGHIVRAQMTKDGKQQSWGAEQNKSTIGREPLVRVTLTDTISNEIAAVGYIKFRIVEEASVAPGATIKTVEFGPYNETYTVDCNNEEVFEKKLSWYEVEEKILALLNISKEEFENTYKLETLNNGAAVQFANNTVDAPQLNPAFGTITLTNQDTEADQTEVLKWEVTNNEAYTQFKTNGKKSVEVYIRFKHNTAQKYVCVKFTWKPNAINVAPSGEISNASKIAEYWYAKNSATAKSGYDDVHINVEVPDGNGAACNFETDLKNTFVKNQLPTISGLADVYAAVKNSANLSTVFVYEEALYKNVPGASGAIYNLYVSTDGSKLFTTGDEEIASITSEGKITVNEKSTAAKDMLNYAQHNQLGNHQTLTAKVGFKATTCAPAGQIALANNTFYVKMLRPVTVTGQNMVFEDATTDGSDQAINLTFIDWRDHNFQKNDMTNGNYYTYYGVKSIKVNVNNITTDMNGGTLGKTLLSSVTKQVEFYFKEETSQDEFAKGNYGTLVYHNNGNTVGAFKVRIPVTITYKWGTLRTYIDAEVKKTVANTQKKNR